jgi:energy-coupling factor transporter ATP-binding protein EcfA2
MITKFKVERFKSIESAELDLGSVNVLIGANGSGKSNLLEALAVLAAAASGRVDQESLMRRGCRPKGFLKPMFQEFSESTETSLNASNGSHDYLVDLLSPPLGRLANWEFKKEVLSLDGRRLVNRVGFEEAGKGDPQAGLAALKLAEGEVSDLAATFLKTLAAYNIYSADTLVMRGLVQDVQPREPVGLSGGRLMEAVSEVIPDQKAFEELNEEFASSFEFTDRFNVFFKPGADGETDGSSALGFRDRYFRPHPTGAPYILGANQINEGALYFLFASVLCLHPSAPKLFAIDNADHGLNPLLARHLMGTMSQWLLESKDERQVLMTTHNPLVLDGLSLNDDRVRLFTVDRDNRGRTVVKRFLVGPEHRKMAAEGWTLSRMWVNGLIGGVPNV